MIVVLLSFVNILFASPWPYMDRTTIGAADFTATNPLWDGRGVAVAVLDTGVDAVPGLLTTPTGEVKIIEARDFSGQGDIPLTEASVDEGGVVSGDGWRVQLDGVEVNSDAELLLGRVDEADFAGRHLEDLNGDGDSEDSWAVLAQILCCGGSKVWIDTDGDGVLSVTEEQPDYAVSQMPFTFADNSLDDNRTLISLSSTLLPRERILSLHFDDGGHGTHVAGIAAGYAMGGVEGRDGVAPGAKVLSLKIGHNAMSGGATVTGSMRKAFEYGAKWSEENNTPVVFNLSYGVRAALAGESGIGGFLDDLQARYPQLVFVVSAGNNGPGISTTGAPGSSRSVISVGSLITPDLSEFLWGHRLKRSHLASYSSRGGDVDKPDIVAPGVAMSTIAKWADSPVKTGTSMSAPEASGGVALLLSAAKQEGIEPTGVDVRRALWAGARPQQGYTSVDQGYGLMQVEASYGHLKRLVASGVDDQVLDYSVKVTGAHQPHTSHRAGYWRAGGYAPTERSGQAFSITPIYPTAMTEDERTQVLSHVRLSSDVSWLTPDRRKLAFKGEGAGDVILRYDKGAFNRPGLYVGRVTGTPIGESVPAFSLQAVVVVPERFELDEEREFGPFKMAPLTVTRLFIEVPPSATVMQIELEVEGDGAAQAMLHGPDGERFRRTRFDDRAEDPKRIIISGDDVRAGTWELDILGSDPTGGSTSAKAKVLFHGLSATPQVVSQFDGGGSQSLKGSLEVTNHGSELFKGRVNGKISSLHRERALKASPEGDWSMSFELTENTPSATFEVTMNDDVFGRMTDVTLRILKGGEVVTQGGVDPLGETIYVRGVGSYELVMVAANHQIDPEKKVPFQLVEHYWLDSPLDITVKGPGNSSALYPSVTTAFSLKADAVLPDAAGFKVSGKIQFIDDRVIYLEVPILLP